MNKLVVREDCLFDWIKGVILNYCPVKDNRLSLMDDARKTPELEIIINFVNDETHVMFMYGNSSFKQSLTEQANVDDYVNNMTITNIIDFILTDHKSISFISLDDINDFQIGFVINWCNEALKGITCGDIILKINFNNNYMLAKSCILTILNKYKNKLEKTKSYQEAKHRYIISLKEDYFYSINKDELLAFISTMDEDELRELLTNHVEDDTFIDYLNLHIGQDKKELKLIKNNN